MFRVQVKIPEGEGLMRCGDQLTLSTDSYSSEDLNREPPRPEEWDGGNQEGFRQPEREERISEKKGEKRNAVLLWKKTDQ